MSDFKGLDAVITGCALEYATDTLAVLERRSKTARAFSTEMLCTLDNFIKVLLFNDRIFFTGIPDLQGLNVIPREAEIQGSAGAKRLFEGAAIFHPLPRISGNTDAVFADVTKVLRPVDAQTEASFSIRCTFPKKQVTIRQEMLTMDAFLVEHAIAQCGAQRFKPVFPGEHLYLGLRSKRLGRPKITHTMADVAGIRLRALVSEEMDKLNKLTRFGAPYLPPLPPIFVTHLLREDPAGVDLVARIIEIRNSDAFRSFRKWAAKWMELVHSEDLAERKKAADALQMLEEFSFDIQPSGVIVRTGLKLARQLAKGDFLGIVLDNAEAVIKYFVAMPLAGLKQFSGANTNERMLQEFLARQFGDKFARNELNGISSFLGLPENLDAWESQEIEIEAVAGRLDNSPPLSRPYYFTIEDPDQVESAKRDFEELWAKAERLEADPKPSDRK